MSSKYISGSEYQKSRKVHPTEQPILSLEVLKESISKYFHGDGYEPFYREIAPGIWRIGKNPSLLTTTEGKEEFERRYIEGMKSEL